MQKKDNRLRQFTLLTYRRTNLNTLVSLRAKEFLTFTGHISPAPLEELNGWVNIYSPSHGQSKKRDSSSFHVFHLSWKIMSIEKCVVECCVLCLCALKRPLASTYRPTRRIACMKTPPPIWKLSHTHFCTLYTIFMMYSGFPLKLTPNGQAILCGCTTSSWWYIIVF